METQDNALNIVGAFGAFGFFMFLAVSVTAVIWSITKQKNAKQETLRQLIASDKPVTVEIIAALRGRPRLSISQSRAAALRSLLWGLSFLITAVASIVAAFQLATLNDPREYVGIIIVLLILPGLFKTAEGIITFVVDCKNKE